ncbi:GntR family transcriptional regulator [Oceanobacillus kapialis]|uniref:GntR family transcriptional regulator n=1 Tax=Oceanobacillus kapialis TaxID=481353 RepID=A0ABW5Q2Y3_9BACI
MSLNYTNSIPLHNQLREAIKKKIFDGKYTKKIPSERELMDEYYVSRSTVRQSINQLVNEGILEKRPGKGTFVVLRPVNDWLGNLSSTNEIIERMGMIPDTKLLKAEIIVLDDFTKEITGLSKAYHFKRLKYANNIPLGIERHYYPIELGRNLSKYDLNTEAFYDLLERELGGKTFEAEQIIKSVKISKEDAALLNIPNNSHVLNANRVITDINGKFVEFENAYYRSDMYSFKIKLSRKQ